MVVDELEGAAREQVRRHGRVSGVQGAERQGLGREAVRRDVRQRGGEDGGLRGWEGGWGRVFVGVVGAMAMVAEVGRERGAAWEGAGDGEVAEGGRWYSWWCHGGGF